MRRNFICFLNIPAGGSCIGLQPEYFKKSKSKRVAA